jgi:hypothetical protein
MSGTVHRGQADCQPEQAGQKQQIKGDESVIVGNA